MTAMQFFTRATFAPLPVVLIVVAGVWYAWSVRRLPRWPAYKSGALVVALAALLVATCSGVGSSSDNFLLHSIQDSLLCMAVPIAFAFSDPIGLAMASTGRATSDRIAQVLQTRTARWLTQPAVTFALFGTSLFALYFSSIYQDSLTNEGLNSYVQLHLIVVGGLFWWPAVAIGPVPRRLSQWTRMFYLLMALVYFTVLGMSIESQTTTIAPHMVLSDLHSGGGWLWLAGETVGLLGTIAVFVQWLRKDERDAQTYDRSTVAAAELQRRHWLATREAAARAIPE
jgi:putative copper resistance protein D